MSAETLRRAAMLMRERAEGATLATGEGPWSCIGTGWNDVQGATWTVRRERQTGVCEAHCEEQADHIASWDPDVALAVADWLDGVALFVEARTEEEWFDLDGDPIASEDTHAIGSALTVARAYLGEAS